MASNLLEWMRLKPNLASQTKKRSYTFISRTPKVTPTISKAEYFSANNSIEFDLQKQCSTRCLDKVPNQTIVNLRNEVWKIDNNLKDWITNYLVANIVIQDEETFYRYLNFKCYNIRWHLNGYDVCSKCWKIALRLSGHRLTTFYLEHSSKGTQNRHLYVDETITWLRDFLKKCCDSSPTNATFYLPQYTVRRRTTDL